MPDKTTNEYQAEIFKNRIKKRYKHLIKWAKRNAVFAFRLYDKDIPEIPLAIDLYFENPSQQDYSYNHLTNKQDSKLQNKNSEVSPDPEAYSADRLYAVMFLYKRPYAKDLNTEKSWADCIIEALGEVLNIPKTKIFFKTREKQKGLSQYKKLASAKTKIIVKEGECLFYINLSDYLDTGLFLDHRTSRLKIFEEAKNKKLLNLYSYTGAFSIHALAANAKQVYSVDLSNTYLNIAKENLKLNRQDKSKAIFVKSCVMKFLEESITKKAKWDIIICDPPTFSNSKQANVFDINKDWKKLCCLCLKVLAPNGSLYFSSNSLKLKFDSKELKQAINKDIEIQDISLKSIPEDFRNKKIHKMWKITFPQTEQK